MIEGALSDIRQKVRDAKITRTALILVGRVLSPETFTDSALYDADRACCGLGGRGRGITGNYFPITPFQMLMWPLSAAECSTISGTFIN